MPSRKDFDPMQIPKVLPFIVMEDVLVNPLRFRIRLIGSKCRTPSKLMGKVLDYFPEMDQVANFLKRGTEMRKPYFYFNILDSDKGYIRHYSSLVLPFSNDDENVNIMMGCISYVDI